MMSKTILATKGRFWRDFDQKLPLAITDNLPLATQREISLRPRIPRSGMTCLADPAGKSNPAVQ